MSDAIRDALAYARPSLREKAEREIDALTAEVRAGREAWVKCQERSEAAEADRDTAVEVLREAARWLVGSAPSALKEEIRRILTEAAS
jgi:hypothetical protein